MVDDTQPTPWSDLLAQFLEANASASVESRGFSWYVTRPWNDDNVIIELTTDVGEQDDIAEALNHVYLPQKLVKTVEERCDPAVIWNEISPLLVQLCQKTVFDGGRAIPARVPEDRTQDTCRAVWHPKLVDTLTKIGTLWYMPLKPEAGP